MAQDLHNCSSLNCNIMKTYPLHHAVWNSNLTELRNAISKSDSIDSLDCRGRTPLLLAVILKNSSAIDLLLQSGANATRKDNSGFTSFDLALSNPGDVSSFSATGFQLLDKLHKYQTAQRKIFISKRFAYLLSSLSKVPDFYYDIQFEYSTIVPFMSSTFPSDTLHVFKRGSNVRVDSRISDISDDGKFVYGNVTYLFRVKNSGFELITIDHNKSTFEKEDYSLVDLKSVLSLTECSSQTIERNLKKLPVKITSIPTSLITLKAATEGHFFVTDKIEQFDGKYDCAQYLIENLKEISSRRVSNKKNRITETDYFNGNGDLLSMLTHKDDIMSADVWFPVSPNQFPLKSTQLYPIIELMELVISDFKKYLEICTCFKAELVPVKFVLKMIPLKVLRMKIELSNLMALVSPVPGVTSDDDGSCILTKTLFDIPNGYNEA